MPAREDGSHSPEAWERTNIPVNDDPKPSAKIKVSREEKEERKKKTSKNDGLSKYVAWLESSAAPFQGNFKEKQQKLLNQSGAGNISKERQNEACF